MIRLLFVLLVLCSGCASRRGVAELAADARFDGRCEPQTTITAKVYVTFSD